MSGKAEETREHAQRILDTVADGVIIQDAAGKVTYMNRVAEGMLGVSHHEFEGLARGGGVVEVTTPEGDPLPDSETPFARVARTREPMYGIDYGLTSAGGERLIISANMAPLLDADGSFEGAVSSFRDITKRYGLERDLRRSNRELEQFAYVASHDLQEPLRMVSSYVQLLERRYGEQLDDDAREFIAYAVDGAKRMQRLVNDLLAFSRIATQGRPFEPVPLDAVLRHVERELQPAVHETGAEIGYGAAPIVLGDELQLDQLFRNLIGNAIKYATPAVAPRIEVRFEEREAEWLVAVQDNGIGIPPEHHDRVFAIFQRLHARHEFTGTGIGLAICRRIVERHRGHIWIESAPGEGTTVLFTLPQAASEREEKRDA